MLLLRAALRGVITNPTPFCVKMQRKPGRGSATATLNTRRNGASGDRRNSAPSIRRFGRLGYDGGMFEFEMIAREGGARCGALRTPHGTVETPAFMPVGTAGSVKGLTPAQLRATGASIILANTYHLQLRPTADVVAALGGLHKFMAWDWTHPD